eukprot:g17949.t1
MFIQEIHSQRMRILLASDNGSKPNIGKSENLFTNIKRIHINRIQSQLELSFCYSKIIFRRVDDHFCMPGMANVLICYSNSKKYLKIT